MTNTESAPHAVLADLTADTPTFIQADGSASPTPHPFANLAAAQAALPRTGMVMSISEAEGFRRENPAVIECRTFSELRVDEDKFLKEVAELTSEITAINLELPRLCGEDRDGALDKRSELAHQHVYSANQAELVGRLIARI